MKDIMHSLTYGFSKIVTWDVMKHALLAGIVAIGLWTFIGYTFWNPLILVSQKILDLLPFSMLRSNGAWMLSAFLWFQIVLISYAVIYALFGNFILEKVKRDKFSLVSFTIILISALFWATVWYFESSFIYGEFLKLLTWLPFKTIEGGMAFLISFYILYNGIIITLLFIASILSYPLIKSINGKINKKHIFKSLGYTLKDTGIFVILSILLFVLMFIPIVNILVQLFLWTWLTKDTVSHDAMYLAQDTNNSSDLKDHKVAIYTISTMSVLFNFVPIMNIFGPFFAEISMFEYMRIKQPS